MRSRAKMILSVLLIALFAMTGCGKASISDAADIKIDQSRLVNICELSTLKCRYHNVATATKEGKKKILFIKQKDRVEFIEYDGYATLGFNADDITINTEGNTVHIHLPDPNVSCSIDDSSIDDSAISGDGLIKNKIRVEDENKAINKAQEKMKKSVENDSGLINSAKQQAQELITNYINEIGNRTGKKYKIIWE